MDEEREEIEELWYEYGEDEEPREVMTPEVRRDLIRLVHEQMQAEGRA